MLYQFTENIFYTCQSRPVLSGFFSDFFAGESPPEGSCQCGNRQLKADRLKQQRRGKCHGYTEGLRRAGG